MKKLHASDILHLINYILYKYSFVPSINIYIYIYLVIQQRLTRGHREHKI